MKKSAILISVISIADFLFHYNLNSLPDRLFLFEEIFDIYVNFQYKNIYKVTDFL